METLEVTILPEDFAKAPNGFYSHIDWQGYFTGCVLYWALKRALPEEIIDVGAHSARVGHRSYKINRKMWGWDEITQEERVSNFSMQKINELSRRAKQSLEGIPTVSLSLASY